MANESNQSVTVQPSVVDSSEELPKYLTCRNGIYYFKRRLPEKIAKALKLKSPQVWKSLKTSSLDVAIERLAIQVREFESLLSPTEKNSPKFGGRDVPSTPRGEGTTKYLLEAHIEPMLSRFEYGHLTTDDEERKDMTRDERAERREMLEDGLEGLYDLAAAEDYSTMDEVAEQLLSIERLIAPPGSASYQLLLKRLLMKDIEVMEIQRDRLKGKMRLTPKELPEGPRELTTLHC